jgi:hypothetical protein
MMSLAYLAALIVYLIIFIAVVAAAVLHAKKTGKSKKLWGGVAAFIMYNLVFWDFLPTLLVHQYYCKKDAGFWVYKTAEQWRKENPDVVVGPVNPPEGMVLDNRGKGEMVKEDGTKLRFNIFPQDGPSLSFDKSDGSTGYWLNDRFFYIRSKREVLVVDVSIDSAHIVDAINNEIMMKDIHVYATPENTIKFWTHIGACGPKGTVLKNLSNYRKLKGI